VRLAALACVALASACTYQTFVTPPENDGGIVERFGRRRRWSIERRCLHEFKRCRGDEQHEQRQLKFHDFGE
jgi:hypothetical protein